MTRNEYIKKYAKLAVWTNLFSGIYPSVVIAQGILESGNGNSGLSRYHHNHFGIKGSTGALMKTFEILNGQKVVIDSTFRTYRNALGSYVDHKNFLKENPRYKKNGVFSAKSPEQQAKALKQAGYATALNYDNTLIKLIEDNDLKRFDRRKRAMELLIIIAAIYGLSVIAKKLGYKKHITLINQWKSSVK